MLVSKNSSGRLYALKMLEKSRIRKRGAADRVISESVSMQQIRHPFVVTLHYAFQDKSRVYFVLEYVPGGDLFGILQEHGHFPEDWCRIYLAEMAMALAWMHTHRLVYRDLKSENILVASDGHLKLADFGTAKRLPDQIGQLNGTSSSMSHGDDPLLHTMIGTPDILAPEIFLETGYSYSVDWWGLGALFSEMLLGESAIISHGLDLGALISSYRTSTHLRPLPSWVSKDATALLTGLLCVSRTERIACRQGELGVQGVKAHPFFAGLDWDGLHRKEITAPLCLFEHDALVSHSGSEEELSRLEAQFTPYAIPDASPLCRRPATASSGDVLARPPRPGHVYHSWGRSVHPRTSLAAVVSELVAPPTDLLVCPLSRKRFEQPVVAADGYTYEKDELAAWVLLHGRFSPITGSPMSAILLPNRTLIGVSSPAPSSAVHAPEENEKLVLADRSLSSIGEKTDLRACSPLTTFAALNQLGPLRSALNSKEIDPNTRDADGDRCPLHWAAARGHTKCALALLKAGADPRRTECSSGMNCSELAATRGHQELAVLLAEAVELEIAAAPVAADAQAWSNVIGLWGMRSGRSKAMLEDRERRRKDKEKLRLSAPRAGCPAPAA